MDFAAARTMLVEHLSREIKDKRVLTTMSRIPRERFVPPEERYFAYEDRPLSIGLGQTISQPFIIALMTQALKLTGKEKVLEVGTGSGYQTAILAELAREIISTERLPALAEKARKVLDELGDNNVQIYVVGRELGWKPEAPYDAIMVTAAAPRVPDDLLAQLKVGGRMVIPAGPQYMQSLYKVTKHRDRNVVENLGGCRFVSLIGDGAWEE
ncbi:protein-L-isoaspartate(D-aspartate) O-methyltransferase [Chloroflexota bacterium]